MKEKKYIFSDDSIYVMTQKANGINDHKLKLRFSNKDKRWSSEIRGKVAAKLHSDGNGVNVAFRDGKTIRLDYCQVQELEWLLKEFNKGSEYTTVGDLRKP
jgi:hypothetical protein